MPCQPSTSILRSLLRSVCEDKPEQTVPVQSTTGAIIFFSYIVLALFLTGAIISFQVQAYQTISSRIQLHGKVNRQLLLRCSLAAISFAVLSYHMLFFLIDSYTSWILVHESGLSSVTHTSTIRHLQLIWEWSTYTPLFATFANDVFVVKGADAVIFLALAWEMMITVSIIAKGRQRQMPHIWYYSFLAQILPISFIQNLFGIATLLDDLDHIADSKLGHNQLSSKQQNQPVRNAQGQYFLNTISDIVINSLYGIVIGTLPLLRRTNLLMPGVLLTRALLLLQSVIPSVYFAPRHMSTRQLGITALTTLSIVTAFGLPYLKINNGQARHLYNNFTSSPAMFPKSFLKDSYLALQSNHAIAALGWDITIGITSLILCTFL